MRQLVHFRRIVGLIVAALCIGLFVANADGRVRVRGYFRKNGTYVSPHYRTAPDGIPYNNYSYPGNYNPNTGEITPGDPFTYLKNYYSRNSTPSYSFSYPTHSTYTSPSKASGESFPSTSNQSSVATRLFDSLDFNNQTTLRMSYPAQRSVMKSESKTTTFDWNRSSRRTLGQTSGETARGTTSTTASLLSFYSRETDRQTTRTSTNETASSTTDILTPSSDSRSRSTSSTTISLLTRP